MVTTTEGGMPMMMGCGDGMGSNWIWAFLLFALIGGGGFGGFGGNRAYGNPATTEDMQNQFNFNALERQNNETISAVSQAKYDAINSLKETQFELSSQINDVRSLGQVIDRNQQECCCSILRAIDGVKYNQTQETQKVLDAIATNKIEALQSKVNQLELQGALCGVVRYPNSMTYNAGTSPFCGCNTGCGCGY